MEIAGWVFAVILGLLWWFSTSAKGSSTPTMTAADAAELDSGAPAKGAGPRADSALERELKETQAILRRRERDTQVQVEQAIDDFARALLPVDEALERALQAQGDVDAYREGMSLVQRLMRNAFERSGLAPIVPDPGARFDPKHHHGVAQEADTRGLDEDKCALEVVSVERTGWLLHGRLLQAADVVVRLVPDPDAEAPDTPDDDTPDDDTPDDAPHAPDPAPPQRAPDAPQAPDDGATPAETPDAEERVQGDHAPPEAAPDAALADTPSDDGDPPEATDGDPPEATPEHAEEDDDAEAPEATEVAPK